MSKHDFSATEFSDRLARVRTAVGEAGLDWFIAIHPVSIHWLTGSDAKSYQEFQVLLISAEPGPLVVLTREGEVNEFRDDSLADEVHGWGGGIVEDAVAVFERLARKMGLLDGTKRIGMEVPAYYLHPYDYLKMKSVLGASLVAEPNNLIHNLKMVKSAKELEYIREAARIADLAMEVCAESIAEGRSELQVSGRVIGALMEAGSGLAASPINFVSGERSCFSHGAPTARLLRGGDYINIEYGATHRRYTSTIGRQFCLGEPTARMREIYDIVREASDVCMAAIRPGVPAILPHEAAKKVIENAGCESGRVHTSGYGLAPGFPPTWGEPIHMLNDSPYILQAGMVITVEPPVFLIDEPLGARIIDNVLITETGCELLSRYTRDLVIV